MYLNHPIIYGIYIYMYIQAESYLYEIILNSKVIPVISLCMPVENFVVSNSKCKQFEPR